MVGLQYFTHGKLAWYLQHTEIAYKSLNKASEILMVTHGQSHSLVQQLMELLSQVRMYQF